MKTFVILQREGFGKLLQNQRSLLPHKALAGRLAELESKIETPDEAIRSLVSAIRQLMAAPERPAKKIAFQLREKRASYGRR